MPQSFILRALTIGCLILIVDCLTAAPGDIIRSYANPAGLPGHQFGAAVAGHEGSLIVTALKENGGTVYIVDPDTGSLTPLPKPPGVAYGAFGSKLFSKGGRLYVTDPDAVVANHPGMGAVFVYQSLQDQNPLIIPNPAGSTTNRFGFSVAANEAGDVVVGAPAIVYHPAPFESGGAYMFSPGHATPRTTITAGLPSRYVGLEVAISDAGKVAISWSTTGGFPYVYFFNLADGKYQYDLSSSWQIASSFGSSLLFIGSHFYTSDQIRDDGNYGNIYRYDSETGVRDKVFRGPNGRDIRDTGYFLIAINNIIVASQYPSGLLFLDENLTLIGQAVQPRYSSSQDKLGALGTELLIGKPLADQSKGVVHLVVTPLSPRSGVAASDWAYYD